MVVAVLFLPQFFHNLSIYLDDFSTSQFSLVTWKLVCEFFFKINFQLSTHLMDLNLSKFWFVAFSLSLTPKLRTKSNAFAINSVRNGSKIKHNRKTELDYFKLSFKLLWIWFGSSTVTIDIVFFSFFRSFWRVNKLEIQKWKKYLNFKWRDHSGLM